MFGENRIENDVRSALQRDPRIKHPQLIAVSVDEIGAVVLSGAVANPRQRQAAVHDARRVDGVFEVIDHLKLHPPIPDRSGDDELRAAATQKLIDDSALRADHIRVTVSDRWITLTGRVMDKSQRAAAAEAVADLGGVAGVSNQIQVI